MFAEELIIATFRDFVFSPLWGMGGEGSMCGSCNASLFGVP